MLPPFLKVASTTLTFAFGDVRSTYTHVVRLHKIHNIVLLLLLCDVSFFLVFCFETNRYITARLLCSYIRYTHLSHVMYVRTAFRKGKHEKSLFVPIFIVVCILSQPFHVNTNYYLPLLSLLYSNHCRSKTNFPDFL